MRVLVPQGERAPIKSSMSVESHYSKTDSNDAERIREQNSFAEFLDQTEKMQRQNDQFNDTLGSVDLFANLDREDNDLLRKFFTEMDVTLPVCDILGYADPLLGDPKNASLDAGLLQVPNTVRQPEMDCNRMAGDYTRGNSEQTPWNGYEMGFGAQQNESGTSRQMQMQAQIAQELAVKEAEHMRTRSENVETEIVSPNNLPPLCASNRLNSLDRIESMQVRSRQCSQKRTITRSKDKVAVDAEHTRQSKKLSRDPGQTDRVDSRSEGSLRKEKQVRANIRVKRSGVAAEKNAVVRGKSTTYSCRECDRAFTEKHNLKRHLRIHSGENEKPFKCGECGITLRDKGCLKRHQMTHSGEKPFKCGECGRSFSQKITLTTHKRVHSGAKPFGCRICNVAFRHKTNLSRHLLIHKNEKPFICDICKQSFRHKLTLSDHMNLHSGNRPYKCNVCQKTFRQRSILSAHRKVHAEKKSSRRVPNF